MIVAKVLVGKSCIGYSWTDIPDLEYDTTTKDQDPDTDVIVKYYDDEFYPEYVAYYER